jgi:hypothetical protein
MNRRIMACFVDIRLFLPNNPAQVILDLIGQLILLDLYCKTNARQLSWWGGREGVKPPPA